MMLIHTQRRMLDLEQLKPSDFRFNDIAGPLSKLCRFAGHTGLFYSVAEHCLHCLFVALRHTQDRNTLRAVLMHDAVEAFIGDITRPVRSYIGGSVDELENRLLRVVHEKFDIQMTDDVRDIVQVVDDIVLQHEINVFFVEKTNGFQPIIEHWGPRIAEVRFLNAAYGLDIDVDS